MPQNNGEGIRDVKALQEELTRLRSDLGEVHSRLPCDSKAEIAAVRAALGGSAKRESAASQTSTRETPLTSMAVLFLIDTVTGWLTQRNTRP